MMHSKALGALLTSIIAATLAGCEAETADSPLAPASQVSASSSVKPVDTGLSMEQLIQVLESAAADPDLQKSWAFGGGGGPVSIQDVLGELRSASNRQASPISSDRAAGTTSAMSWEECQLDGTSGVGVTGGMAPSTRNIIFMASSKVWDPYTMQPCSQPRVGGTSSITVRQGTNQIHSNAFNFSCWFCDYAWDQRWYNYTGPQVSASIDTQHTASGFNDEYSGALGSSL